MIKFFILSTILIYAFSIVCDPEPGKPILSPMGKEKGIIPSRVSWGWNTSMTSWDGETGFYWEKQNIDEEILKDLLEKIIISQTKETNLKDAWIEIFKYFNKRKYGKNQGYKPGEKIVIKINLNQDFFFYNSTNGNELTPQFLKALFNQLVNIVGIKEEDIYIYDASRLFVTKFAREDIGFTLKFPKINVFDNFGGMSYVQKIKEDRTTPFYFSSKAVPEDDTFLPKIATEATYAITINNFRGHQTAGITGTAKNFFGAIFRPKSVCHAEWGTNNHWCPSSLHDFIRVNVYGMNKYSPLVDLLGHDSLADKAVINLVDGLYGGDREDKHPASMNAREKNKDDSVPPCRFQSYPFNNHWSSSIFASIDPIALDSVLFDFLRNEPNVPYPSLPGWCVDNYLHEAAQANDPPSGTFYAPNDQTTRLDSLGVHEHWNNNKEKQYSRNLGKNYGIELFKIF